MIFMFIPLVNLYEGISCQEFNGMGWGTSGNARAPYQDTKDTKRTLGTSYTRRWLREKKTLEELVDILPNHLTIQQKQSLHETLMELLPIFRVEYQHYVENRTISNYKRISSHMLHKLIQCHIANYTCFKIKCNS